MDIEPVVDHRHRIGAHLAGADRVVDGFGLAPHERFDLGVALDGGAGKNLRAAVRIERRGGQHAARRAHAVDHRLQVGALGEVVRVDQRRRARIGAAQGDVAAAGGAQRAGVQRVAVAPQGEGSAAQGARVAIEAGGGEMKLQVGQPLLRAAPDEAARLGRVAGERAGAVRQVVVQALELGRQGAHRQAERYRQAAAVHHQHVEVILQVAADAGQRVAQRDAVARQLLRLADPGEHQQLRRIDGASRQQHFAAGGDARHGAGAPVSDAGGALAVEQHALGQCAGQHRQVGARRAQDAGTRARRSSVRRSSG